MQHIQIWRQKVFNKNLQTHMIAADLVPVRSSFRLSGVVILPSAVNRVRHSTGATTTAIAHPFAIAEHFLAESFPSEGSSFRPVSRSVSTMIPLFAFFPTMF
jgi:hypothetical protein